MKNILLITFLSLLSCSDDSCEDEIRSINQKYESQVKQINERQPIDQIQLNLVNNAWRKELENIDC
ncbi:MAG: hypothetical protein KGZ87_05585 [Bacteroidetes bacterium]|nr:hypothetical protein [Bacteroidota bacterium]